MCGPNHLSHLLLPWTVWQVDLFPHRRQRCTEQMPSCLNRQPADCWALTETERTGKSGVVSVVAYLRDQSFSRTICCTFNQINMYPIAIIDRVSVRLTYTVQADLPEHCNTDMCPLSSLHLPPEAGNIYCSKKVGREMKFDGHLQNLSLVLYNFLKVCFTLFTKF